MRAAPLAGECARFLAELTCSGRRADEPCPCRSLWRVAAHETAATREHGQKKQPGAKTRPWRALRATLRHTVYEALHARWSPRGHSRAQTQRSAHAFYVPDSYPARSLGAVRSRRSPGESALQQTPLPALLHAHTAFYLSPPSALRRSVPIHAAESARNTKRRLSRFLDHRRCVTE